MSSRIHVPALQSPFRRFVSRLQYSLQIWALRATGVDVRSLDEHGTHEEKSKFVAIGTIVYLTSLFAFFGALFFFFEIFRSLNVLFPVLFCIPFAVLWGLMIFNVDRAFLSSMLGLSGWRKFASGLLRLVLAGILGFLISHPLKMIAFSGTIGSYEELSRELTFDSDFSQATNAAELAEKKRDAAASALREARENLSRTELQSRRAFAELQRDTALEVEQLERGSSYTDSFPLEFRFDAAESLRFALERAPGVSGGCSDFDIRYQGYFNRNEADPTSDASYDWFRNLVEDYAQFKVNSRERFEDPYIDGDQPVMRRMVSTCTMARIAGDFWTKRLEVVNERLSEPKTVAESDILRFQSDLNREQKKFEQAQDRLIDSESRVRRKIGEGYPNKAAIYSAISDPSGEKIPLSIQQSTAYSQYSFSDPDWRRAVFWIGVTITIVFIFFEIAPVGLKIVIPSGSYESWLEEKMLRDRAELKEQIGEVSRRKREERHRLDDERAARDLHAADTLLGFQSILMARLSRELEKEASEEGTRKLIASARANWESFRDLLNDIRNKV